jgi:predicted dinucleotide-binding enzyme
MRGGRSPHRSAGATRWLRPAFKPTPPEESVRAHVSIIGTGNMGSAISSLVTKGGKTVEVFNSSDADKPVTGDIVVRAVSYPAVADVIPRRGEHWPATTISSLLGVLPPAQAEGRDLRELWTEVA